MQRYKKNIYIERKIIFFSHVDTSGRLLFSNTDDTDITDFQPPNGGGTPNSRGHKPTVHGPGDSHPRARGTGGTER